MNVSHMYVSVLVSSGFLTVYASRLCDDTAASMYLHITSTSLGSFMFRLFDVRVCHVVAWSGLNRVCHVLFVRTQQLGYPTYISVP